MLAGTNPSRLAIRLERQSSENGTPGIELTQILGPVRLEAGGQVLAGKQQPGKGPFVMQFWPFGHCRLGLEDSIDTRGSCRTYAVSSRGAEGLSWRALNAGADHTARGAASGSGTLFL